MLSAGPDRLLRPPQKLAQPGQRLSQQQSWRRTHAVDGKGMQNLAIAAHDPEDRLSFHCLDTVFFEQVFTTGLASMKRVALTEQGSEISQISCKNHLFGEPPFSHLSSEVSFLLQK